MKGLILKDILSLKSHARVILLFVVGFGVMGIVTGNAFLTTYASVYAAIAPISCFAYDESCRFPRFSATLPLTPAQIVTAKYLLGLIFAAFGAIISAVALIAGNENDFLSAFTSAVVIPVAYHIFSYPILFKMGVEKSRILTVGIFVIPFVLLSVFSSIFDFSGIVLWLDSLDMTVGFIVLSAVAVVLYIGSILLSISIYKNKEW